MSTSVAVPAKEIAAKPDWTAFPDADPNDFSVHVPANNRAYFRFKKSLERGMGLVLLAMASPVILILIAVVKTTSKGPGLYRQKRVGHCGKVYEILKIRTMRSDAESDGVARWSTQGDNRITPLGKFLRKVHLDELPQLINVVRGEMVLVGPRPERPEFVVKLARQIDNYYDRLSVVPGITGLAQINLPPDSTIDDARRKQALDLLYIEEASFWLDTRMLLATALRMCGIKGDSVMKMMRLSRESHLDALNLLEEKSPTTGGKNGSDSRVKSAVCVDQIAQADNFNRRKLPRNPK